MIVIRSEQQAAFRAAAENRFAARMHAHVAAEYPEHHARLGEDGTRELIQRAVAAGARWGLDGEGQVGALIELMVEFGEKLERSPDRAWAETILGNPGLPGAVKVTAVREKLLARTGGRSLVPV